ncbi:hypothetical protein [Sphingomicrobium arenosum]|uniref:hypothetical protein n=1 Tax=Sphingomicrobium arenosum TaxID=2233861 RepID=UPI00224100F6|nr:hypothetical protein [Sphingomicrobium arenosum]
MRLDRAEWAGNGMALGLHVALVAALSLNLAKHNLPAEPPAVFVEFVDDVGFEAAAPSQVPTEAPQATTPDLPDDSVPPPPEPDATPEPPRAEPTPTPPRERATPTPTPPRERVRPRPRPTGRLGDDLLKGVNDGNSRSGEAETASPSAPAFSAQAQAGIVQAIRRQIQPCANRQIDPGPGANEIVVTLNLRLDRRGNLIRPPRVTRTSGVDGDNQRYEQRVKDLAIAAYQGCSPLTGLPEEFYDRWKDFDMTYKLP